MKISIIIPAYNEEQLLQSSITAIVDFCQTQLVVDWQVIICDNGSTDRTSDIGQQLAEQYSPVEYLSVPTRGKGAAIRAGWQHASADIYCFMDADLATDLTALPRLIAGIIAGSNMVVGSRFHSESIVSRSWQRKIYSKLYQLLVKVIMNVAVRDIPCGFKAIDSKIKELVVPQIVDNQWFFDSELVIRASRLGYRILEVPVVWHEPRQQSDSSRVKPVRLGLLYIKKLLGLRRQLFR